MKIKQNSIAVENQSTEETHNDLGWLEDDSDDEEVENGPDPTTEDKQKEMISAIKKEFKQVLKNWRGLSRAIKWKE